MLKLKMPCTLLLLLTLQSILQAQDKLNIKFGKVRPEDFDVKSVLIDSSTNAVVVADVGSTEFIANTSELTFSLIFKEKKRIKIITKNGYDAATIIIPLYIGDNDRSESLEDLDAYTYNLENGKVEETKVSKSAVFTEKHSKHWIYKKFTFPALKEGCIIEYSFRIKSDFFFNLQPWKFQGEYPVLWSQYEAGIPEFYKFVILAQGYQQFFINKTDESQSRFTFVEHVDRDGGGFGSKPVSSGLNTINLDGKVDHHTWVMKNVPGLKEELYTTTLSNAVAKIEFQLNQVAFPNTFPKNYMDSWEKVAQDLMQDSEFGVPIEKANNWLDDDVANIVKSAATSKEKTQKIFEWVRDNFTCNNHEGIQLSTSLKDVFKNKSGSVADINLLLIAMLRSEKIEANPVILSTRENGFTHELYPLITRYNYVIAKVVTDNSLFYLDATIPRLEFGTLPEKVYNGQAREITNNMATPLYFIADSLKETGATVVYISNIENGGVEGILKHDFGVYESLKLRNKMAATLADDFKKSFQQDNPEDITIDGIKFDSLKLLKEPVGLKYSMKFKSFGKEDIVYFTPMLSEALKKNPFTAAERYYPVEMPYTIDENYMLTMEIPNGYKVDELPKSVKVKFNENDGLFEYAISADKTYINMRCRLLLNKATFLNEDYQSLRDLYAFIVKKEAEQIVFKKIR
jgi:uncharacterized protein YfkK (UPF0435 family)